MWSFTILSSRQKFANLLSSSRHNPPSPSLGQSPSVAIVSTTVCRSLAVGGTAAFDPVLINWGFPGSIHLCTRGSALTMQG